jgi:hypothetical protein
MFGLRWRTDCTPQHDRHRQHEFEPALCGHRHPAQAVAEHRQQRHDGGERQRPPEAALEVTQLRVLVIIQARQHRLQRHAAFGTVAGLRLADFGVHRTGVDRTCHGFLGGRRCRCMAVRVCGVAVVRMGWHRGRPFGSRGGKGRHLRNSGRMNPALL